jgi:hypothetical protein
MLLYASIYNSEGTSIIERCHDLVVEIIKDFFGISAL